MRDNKNHNEQSHLIFNRNSSHTMAQIFFSFSNNCKVNCYVNFCCASHSKMYANNFKILEMFKKNVSLVGKRFQLEK